MDRSLRIERIHPGSEEAFDSRFKDENVYFGDFMIDSDISIHQGFHPRFDRTCRELLTRQFN